jgi:hypothetical protein
VISGRFLVMSYILGAGMCSLHSLTDDLTPPGRISGFLDLWRCVGSSFSAAVASFWSSKGSFCSISCSLSDGNATELEWWRGVKK